MPHRASFLTRFNEADETIEARLIAELNTSLGHPEPIDMPQGSLLFRQNDPLGGIFILMEGVVSLSQQIDGKDVIFHSHTVGRILGLLALSRQSRSFFSCRATTPVRMLKVTFEDLDRALQANELLKATFVTVLIRSMARRNTRLVELQTEHIGLHKKLAAERDTLAQTLDELQRAQSLLVESEKMATLGQLSAGVAHELNNPIAAINRAAQFLHEDLVRISGEFPDGGAFREMLERAFRSTTFSTREQRAFRKILQQELGDEQLAERLVSMGIHQADSYRMLTATMAGDESDKLERLERYQQLGGALRNIERCAGRIAELVKSLRSYSRADKPDREPINIHEGLEDTLLLFSNRMRDITINRHYADLPPVISHGGELNQVWTNLIGNAIDAMHEQGRITLETAHDAAAGTVAVRIIDSGPGIPPEHLDKIFNLRFTTRKGRIEFGLGLGLSISQNIIARHGGTIVVQSSPGRTEFCVTLPIEPVSEDALMNPTEKPS